jgi:hypothetical protein
MKSMAYGGYPPFRIIEPGGQGGIFYCRARPGRGAAAVLQKRYYLAAIRESHLPPFLPDSWGVLGLRGLRRRSEPKGLWTGLLGGRRFWLPGRFGQKRIFHFRPFWPTRRILRLL